MNSQEEAPAMRVWDEMRVKYRKTIPTPLDSFANESPEMARDVRLEFASRFLAAIRESQEPVAWKYWQSHSDSMGGISIEYSPVKIEGTTRYGWTPLYTFPPAKEQDGMVKLQCPDPYDEREGIWLDLDDKEKIKKAGLAIVPREPTEEMLAAARKHDWDNPTDPTWGEIYKAMLTAWEKQS